VAEGVPDALDVFERGLRLYSISNPEMGNICSTDAWKESGRVSKLTDDELVLEIHKVIDKGMEMKLDEICVANAATEEYFHRFSANGNTPIRLDKLKIAIDTYNKPYTLSLGRPYALIIHFVIFPKV